MITDDPSTWHICLWCNQPIAPFWISREATWIVLGADRPMHRSCYLERTHEDDGQAGVEGTQEEWEAQAAMFGEWEAIA